MCPEPNWQGECFYADAPVGTCMAIEGTVGSFGPDPGAYCTVYMCVVSLFVESDAYADSGTATTSVRGRACCRW